MINVFGCDAGELECEAASDSIRKGWMGLGPKVAEFEKKFSEKRNFPDFAMLDSGSNALAMAIKLLNLRPNSEILVPSFTWVACANAVEICGHKVKFCDVDYDTGNISRESISKSITKNTNAIMVVHYAGHPVEMEELKKFGVPIIEDCAHAVDSSYKKKSCGSFGEISIFSFDPVKNLATPEGGGITSPNTNIVKLARDLRYCGIAQSGYEAAKTKGKWWEYDILESAPKMIPTDVSAAIALVQLDRLEEMQAKRKIIWQRYKEELKNVDLPPEPPHYSKHSYFTFLIKIKNRNEAAKKLLSSGIYTNLRYHPLHLNKIYKQQDISLPVCEELNKSGLNLPLHPKLNMEEVDKIIQEVNNLA
jgi:aminotransferase